MATLSTKIATVLSLVTDDLSRWKQLPASERAQLFCGLFMDEGNEGVALSHIVQELSDRSRAPLPQNVVFSLEDWGDQAGVLVLDDEMVLTGRRAEVVERFAAHPRLAERVTGRRGDRALRLHPDVVFEDLRDLARDLGFLIERKSEQEGPEDSQ